MPRWTSPATRRCGEFCDFMDGVDTLPDRAAARRLAPLPALVLRVGGTRPGAAPGRDRDRRGARPRAAARSTSSPRCGSPRARTSPPRSRPCAASSTPTQDLRFKLDPTNDWNDELIAALVETGAVDSLDLKGFYKGTPVDVETDPELYAKLIEAFPDAWLEDPDVNERDPAAPRAGPRAAHLGRADPLDRRHRVAALVAAEDGQRQALAGRQPARPLRDLRLLRRARDRRLRRRPEGALGRPRPDPGTWPRSSTPTRPTTRPRAVTTKPTPSAGLPTSPMEPALSPTGFRWT